MEFVCIVYSFEERYLSVSTQTFPQLSDKSVLIKFLKKKKIIDEKTLNGLLCTGGN